MGDYSQIKVEDWQVFFTQLHQSFGFHFRLAYYYAGWSGIWFGWFYLETQPQIDDAFTDP